MGRHWNIQIAQNQEQTNGPSIDIAECSVSGTSNNHEEQGDVIVQGSQRDGLGPLAVVVAIPEEAPSFIAVRETSFCNLEDNGPQAQQSCSTISTLIRAIEYSDEASNIVRLADEEGETLVVSGGRYEVLQLDEDDYTHRGEVVVYTEVQAANEEPQYHGEQIHYEAAALEDTVIEDDLSEPEKDFFNDEQLQHEVLPAILPLQVTTRSQTKGCNSNKRGKEKNKGSGRNGTRKI
ncbi:hypothetical protein IFM89_039999 [Coptis chinensis]|uniref:Uncharacterized protein n=1 Tax=Coptis chinensis TaxID=261450 RepID=A0A835LGS7_9MAGN|nr:hypothetical protein IFM89_039999 [Coptis chinensis]